MAKPGLRVEREFAGQAAGGAGQRRVLTALNYDLVGSTALLDVLDIEDYQDLIGDFQREAGQAIAALAGALQDVEGDGGMATFPVDIDARDAASLAIQAGFEIVAACRRVGIRWKRLDLHVRIGIATSLSLVHDPLTPAAPPRVTGAALALATRLQALASPDTIYVSQETRGLARRSHLFQLQGTSAVKGFASPEQIWRAIGHRRKVDRYFAFGRLNAAFSDRLEEQDELQRSWKRAAAGHGQALLIEGEAGIGKSRLIHRIRAFMRGSRARRIMLQCHPSGSRTTLHPILQAMPKPEETAGRQVPMATVNRLFRETGIYDREAIDIFAYLLGAAGAGTGLKDAGYDVIRERSGWAARRSIESLCATGPLLLVVEDIHWIDPTSLQLLTEALRVIDSLPVLVILTSRPFPAERRPGLPNTRLMPLGPLARKEAQNIIVAKFPRHDQAGGAALLDLIEKVAGGVPLFIEEICQWASENLQSAKEALANDVSPNRLSAFESVVTARLVQFGSAVDVAGAAAVAGSRFDAALLQAMLPSFEPGAVEAAIAELLKQGFLVQVTLSEPALYGFRHALIRETVYKSLLRGQRQSLHGRIYAAVHGNRGSAPWLGTAALAEHAESAGLAAEAIGCLIAAGTENASRSAFTEARQLLEHGLALCRDIGSVSQRDQWMLRTMKVLGPVLTTSEGPGSEPAQKLYEEGIEIARRRPAAERAAWFPIFWGWWFTGSDVNGARAHALLDDMKDVDDAEVQLQSRHCVWAIDFYLGHHGVCVTSVDEALPLYDRHPELQDPSQYGGHDTKVCGLAHRGLSLWFKGQTGQAIVSLQQAKSWAGRSGHAGSIAHACINRAMLASYRRDFAGLRSEIADLRTVTAGNRFPTLDATAQILEAWCEGLAGQPASGRDLLRRGLDIHRKLQTPEDYPVYCTMLAEILVATGEPDEALRLLDATTEESGGTGHVFWLAELHRRRAHVLALRRAPRQEVIKALELALDIAAQQEAVPLLLKSFATLIAFDAEAPLAARFADRVEAARQRVDADLPLFATREPIAMPGSRA